MANGKSLTSNFSAMITPGSTTTRAKAGARAFFVVVLVAVLGTTGTAGAEGSGPRGRSCRPRTADTDYARRLESALRARRDVWGEALLRAGRGPTYEGARAYLRPLLLARGPAGRLTESGFHYLAFTQPAGPDGSGSGALHVADGSQVLTKRVGGRALTIRVGNAGRERYGSCTARLTLPRLADGYLPILATRYVDAAGARYRQESFASRVSVSSPLVSYVRITADARSARGDVEVRVVPGPALVVPARTIGSLFVAWPHAPASDEARPIERTTYEAARAAVVRYWQQRLTEGAAIDVPEPHVRDAVRNLLIQSLGHGWRYSLGNPYQEFSYPEALDVAQVLSAYGFSEVAGAILRRSLATPRRPYANWRIGQKLVGTALHYRLFRDRDLVDDMTSALAEDVASLTEQLRGGHEILDRERYSSDIPDLVYGLHSQAVVWQGLRAIGDVWAETGRYQLSARCRRLARSLEGGLRRAVARSREWLADGSLFLPMRLLDREPPYRSLTETRSGSYWNLVAPYAFASGILAPGSVEARAALAYLLAHGSRLLGLVRAGAYSLYGPSAEYPTSGVNPVYGLNVARFLADNDRPDQLVLSLYGQLAAGMSPGTFVSGEAASVTPLRGERFRVMYLPPNAASNASFLETLRLLLVHEMRDRSGRASGLELAFATPRPWLAPGKAISVRDVPTSFGPVTYSLAATSRSIRASVDIPTRANPQNVFLRVRLPRGQRVSAVSLDGKPFRRGAWNEEELDLSGLGGHVDLLVRVSGR